MTWENFENIAICFRRLPITRTYFFGPNLKPWHTLFEEGKAKRFKKIQGYSEVGKNLDFDFRCSYRLGWEDKSWAGCCISGASYYICEKWIYIRQYHVILPISWCHNQGHNKWGECKSCPNTLKKIATLPRTIFFQSWAPLGNKQVQLLHNIQVELQVFRARTKYKVEETIRSWLLSFYKALSRTHWSTYNIDR